MLKVKPTSQRGQYSSQERPIQQPGEANTAARRGQIILEPINHVINKLNGHIEVVFYDCNKHCI